MPRLEALVAPSQCALVTQECQEGAIGPDAVWPALADAAASILPNLASLAVAARRAGVPVLHCINAKRTDLKGTNDNAPLFGTAKRSGRLRAGSADAELISAIPRDDTDVVLERVHSVSPMYRTGLDAILRNLDVQTVVIAGVSVNVAIFSMTLDAVNAGYQVVLPRDAVAGVPPEYAESVITNSLSLLATVVDTSDIVTAWEGIT